MKASRLLIGFEIVVCLGPVLVMLAVGVVLFPIWIGMLLLFATNPDRFIAGSGGVLAVSISVGVSVLGILGAISVIRLYSLVWQPPPTMTSRRVTLALTSAGLVALVGFNLIDGNVSLSAMSERPWVFLFLFMLPMVCAAHILYLLRTKLFSGPAGA